MDASTPRTAHRVVAARRHVPALSVALSTKRGAILVQRSLRDAQAAEDLWLAITAANPSIGQGGTHPAEDAAAMLVSLGGALLLSHDTHGLPHTGARLVVAALLVALVGVGVKAVRRWQRTRADRRAFAALPAARRESTAADYVELQRTTCRDLGGSLL